MTQRKRYGVIHISIIASLLLVNSAIAADSKETYQLDSIGVTDTQDKPADDGISDGFLKKPIFLGPLGNKKSLDVPYTVNQISKELIDDSQVNDLRSLLKFLPSTQNEERQGVQVARPQTRGFEGSVYQNTKIDGMDVVGTTAYPMEQFESIQVLSGISGSLYGPSSPSGIFNFISKRPTDNPLYSITAGYATQGIGTYSADVSGHTGKDNFLGYRVNVLFGEGTGYADDSYLRRDMENIALDFKITDKTTLETNFSHYQYITRGLPGEFGYGDNGLGHASTSTKVPISLPSAPDPTTQGYGQSWAGYQLETTTEIAKLKHNIDDNWKLIFGALNQAATRNMLSPINSFTNSSGAYNTYIGQDAWAKMEINSYEAYINGKASTGDIIHDISFGSNGFEARTFNLKNSVPYTKIGSASLSNPQELNYNGFNVNGVQSVGDSYVSGRNRNANMTVADDIIFNEHWSILASLSQSWFVNRAYNTNGTIKGNDAFSTGASPAVSVMYKPRENITTYVTYADSLLQDTGAPSTNVGDSVLYVRSLQYEAGIKATVSGIDMSAAIFRINRPYAYTPTGSNSYSVQGEQVNNGLELMAAGKITDNTSIFGGVTFLDPKLKNTKNSYAEDKQVVGVPRTQANMLIEYAVPFVSGLTLSTNVHYTGKRPADIANSTWADAYETVDAGVKYATKIASKKTIFRLSVTNLTDQHYWASIYPGNINGDAANNSGNKNLQFYNAYVGNPREVMASVTVNF